MPKDRYIHRGRLKTTSKNELHDGYIFMLTESNGSDSNIDAINNFCLALLNVYDCRNEKKKSHTERMSTQILFLFWHFEGQTTTNKNERDESISRIRTEQWVKIEKKKHRAI